MEEWSYPVTFLAVLMVYFVVSALVGAPVEFWQWVEQLSWLAALAALLVSVTTLIVAVWLGLPQLRQIRDEQRRLYEEQTRKPMLRVGLKSLNLDRPQDEDHDTRGYPSQPNHCA